MGSAPSTFHHFPDLPAELRISIWHHALQEIDKPALYTYKEGCWDAQDEHPHGPVKINIQHEKLTPVEVKIPIAHVNREARDIATSWALKAGMKRHYIPHKECHVFARIFDPERDILYLFGGEISEYYDEMDNWLCGGYGDELLIGNISLDVRRVALPAKTVDTIERKQEIMDPWFLSPTKGLKVFRRLKEVCFVLGPQPEYFGPAKEIVEPGWDLEEVESRGLGLRWDGSRKRFEIGEDEHPARRKRYERVGVVCQWVSEKLVKRCDSDRIEARPVFVVRS